MAVKYVREGYRKNKEGVFGRGTPVVTDQKKTKQRLLLVYFGVSVLAALSLIFQLLEVGKSLTDISVEHGEARIVAMPVVEAETGEKRYFLDLRVEWRTSDSDPPESTERAVLFLDDRMEVSRAVWNGFREGDLIPVIYRIDPARERLIVQAILSEGTAQRDE